MDFYDNIIAFKKTNRLNNNDLGLIVLMNGDTFRKALNRKSLSEMEIKVLEEFMSKGIEKNEPLGKNSSMVNESIETLTFCF